MYQAGECGGECCNIETDCIPHSVAWRQHHQLQQPDKPVAETPAARGLATTVRCDDMATNQRRPRAVQQACESAAYAVLIVTISTRLKIPFVFG